MALSFGEARRRCAVGQARRVQDVTRGAAAQHTGRRAGRNGIDPDVVSWADHQSDLRHLCGRVRRKAGNAVFHAHRPTRGRQDDPAIVCPFHVRDRGMHKIEWSIDSDCSHTVPYRWLGLFQLGEDNKSSIVD